MLLAECAGTFSSSIGVRRMDAKDTVDGKSIMQLLMLAGTAGTVLEITAEGDDAAAALTSIAELIEREQVPRRCAGAARDEQLRLFFQKCPSLLGQARAMELLVAHMELTDADKEFAGL